VSDTIVLQSFHAKPWPAPIEFCVESVKTWAKMHGHEYEFVGDEILELLPPLYRERCFGRWPVKTDLARLLLLREHLRAGAKRAVWIDVDVLIFAPRLLVLDNTWDHAVGREVWVSKHDNSTWRARRHVHNAVLSFDTGSPALEFLIHATRRVVERLERPASPQIAGPKLLGALHNLISFPVLEAAGMVSPPVLADLAAGEGSALKRHRQALREPMAAANLCHSLLGTTVDGILVDEPLMRAGSMAMARDLAETGLCP
jgi:hypothetical protein